MTIPPTIVFDLDGTLVDTAGDLATTLNIVLAGEGVAPVAPEAVIPMVGRGARAMLKSAFAAESRDLAPDRLEALFRDFLAVYDDRLADTSRPYPGVEAALDRFAADNWLLAVCTNKTEAPAKKLLNLLGLSPRFAAIAGQNTFGVAKPDPRHLTETIRAAGGDPANAVMVGDSATDVDTAIAAGLPSVAVTFGYSPTPVTDLGATRLIDHFDRLYETVAEIRLRPSPLP